jgi:anthranilate phosphoribosyltransferase
MQHILGGGTGPVHDIVVFNAGCALYVAGAATDVAHGIELARESIKSGKAGAVLQAVAQESTRQEERMGRLS